MYAVMEFTRLNLALLRVPVDPKMGSGNGAGDALDDGLYLAIETMPTRI